MIKSYTSRIFLIYHDLRVFKYPVDFSRITDKERIPLTKIPENTIVKSAKR